jgi:integrating conjugative element protein (TIGR03761 family)
MQTLESRIETDTDRVANNDADGGPPATEPINDESTTGGDPVPLANARPASQRGPVGRLADKTPDAMTLHTREAWQMFAGRRGDAAGQVAAIPGGRRFAAVLRSIWALSARDNPYADWILIRVTQRLGEIRAQMAGTIEAREAELERLRARGLSLSVLASSRPVTVELGFRSPYGYATAEAIVEFDYHVRLVQTLMLKDRLSDEAGREAIREIGRGLRALFLEPIRWERALMREEMLSLSRADFLPGADEAARLRVQAAVSLCGEVPRAVFTGQEAPRHTRRRVTPTAAELRLLREASLSPALELSIPAGEQLL